jgi:tRNA threonylcarbamoyladenosine biosynthesis protein TsaE
MSGTEILSHSPEETVELGRQLAQRLQPPVLLLLSGELGSGKTTITKGIVSGLGAAREEDVTSPTFTLVHVFRSQAGEKARIYHVDLYRVDDSHSLESLALEDALSEPGIVIIEWAERFTFRSDWLEVTIRLEHVDAETRRITISPAEILGP